MSPGLSIAHYRVIAKIGEGGMGAVYRATDTKLNRDVAIKVLPDALADDPDYLARFTREAQVLAALSHPNISAVYGVEERAIIMELVEGRDLPTPLPLDEALGVARQIADALEAAHEKGIIHRDLKPANIKLTPDGTVKVLDFGLAKSGDGAVATASATLSPTLTFRATQIGTIMGTAAYMAPEQAAGKTVDRRADIWSFGVVLYEMLTGVRLFEGETVAHTLADVLRADIDFAKLPDRTPASIRGLLARCLERNPRRRLRDIGEARVQLEDAIAHPETAAAAGSPRKASRRLWPYVAIAAAVPLASLAFVYWQRQAPPADVLTAKFHILPPAGFRFAGVPAVSPDGRRIVTAMQDAQALRQLWLYEMETAKLQPMNATAAASNPFWSPDGRTIGFTAEGKLKRVDVGGGQVLTIADTLANATGATWSQDGIILYAIFGSPLRWIKATGGTPTADVFADTTLNRATHRSPQFLPDGKRFLVGIGGTAGRDGIYIATLDSKEPPRRVMEQATEAVFVADNGGETGYLFFRGQLAVLAVRFDARRGQVMGEPFAAIDNAGSINNRIQIASSVPGRVLAWRESLLGVSDNAELTMLDRSGRRVGPLDAGSAASHVEISPDGSKVISERSDPRTLDTNIWIFELTRKLSTRLSFGGGSQTPAVWAPDGKRLIFYGTIDGVQGMFTAPADGSGRPELLAKGNFHHLSVSPDGKYLAFETGVSGSKELYGLSLSGGATPQALLKSTGTLGNPQFSPDGHWLSYSSAESGRKQVMVESFPPGAGRWQVSNDGGSVSRWRRDGREIVYYDDRGHVFSVPVSTRGAGLELGAPVKIFDAVFLNAYFAISADAQRFYANLTPERQGNANADPQPITVVLNWTAGLKR